MRARVLGRRVKTPNSLSRDSTRLWHQFTTAYTLSEEGFELLALALMARDRAMKARQILRREGLVVRAKSGLPHPHPAAHLLKDAEDTFIRAMRELGLEQ